MIINVINIVHLNKDQPYIMQYSNSNITTGSHKVKSFQVH